MLARREVRALLRAFFDKRDQRTGSHTKVSPEGVYIHELSGGHSGSFVALIWVTGLPTLIMKAGPADMIKREAEAREQYLADKNELTEHHLEHCSDPVEIEVEGHDDLWRMMMYKYAGSLTYRDISRFSDFDGVFNDFVDPRDPAHRPSAMALEDWLESLFKQVASRKLEDEVDAAQDGVRSKPLSSFLPDLRWSDGLQAVLSTAAAFVPEGDQLLKFRDWWDHSVQRESLAPYANMSRLHGDLHFGNVLVNRTTAHVELIDFGHSTTGHVFRDLARFECDLLFRIAPPPIETPTSRRSVEDRRAYALEIAFGTAFAPPVEDSADPDNPQIAALRILRGVYDQLWHINAYGGRRRMYYWFLLAEVLKRLTWTGGVFGTTQGRRALLQGVILLARSLEAKKATAPGFSAVANLSTLLGCRAAYIPTRRFERVINKERNAAKIGALEKSAERGETVRLIAETAYSYFHFRGPFRQEVENLLDGRGTFRVILINPYFVESHGISASFREPGKLDDSELHPQVRDKFTESEAGYRQLKARVKERLEVRVARYRMGASVLLTGSLIFFEPYFYKNRGQRWTRVFDTFELCFDGTNENARKLFQAEFDFHWDHSIKLENIVQNKGDYLEMLSQLRGLWDE